MVEENPKGQTQTNPELSKDLIKEVSTLWD